MNRFKALGSAFLLIPALAFVSTQARAEFKCDAPQMRVDRAACEKAAESPHALRQYIQRMRMINSLLFSDYVNEAQASAWTLDVSNHPSANRAPVQTAKSSPEDPGA